MVTIGISAEEALGRLKEGNQKYLTAKKGCADISPEIRKRTAAEGQHPYAVIVSCSDSRVIPEEIFSAGIGELFVIRVAGNVIGAHQLGSIEYAAEHLGCLLTVVLGHTHCGAVGAALKGGAEGQIKTITDEISGAIGGEKDEYRACCLNVRNSRKKIEENLADVCGEGGMKVIEAVYDTQSGLVTFLSSERPL